MIFSGDLFNKVLDGTKTQTRRPVKLVPCPTCGSEMRETECRYTVGRDYAVVPGRGKYSAGRIRILAVRRVAVYPISKRDAIAEGFESPAAFLARWRELYDNTGGDCWRITFKLVNK